MLALRDRITRCGKRVDPRPAFHYLAEDDGEEQAVWRTGSLGLTKCWKSSVDLEESHRRSRLGGGGDRDAKMESDTRRRTTLEVNDMTAQLKLPGSGALNLDLIGGTLWLDLWDPRPFVHDANTMICPVAYGQSSSSSAGAVPKEGGMVITSSRAGAVATGKLRAEPIPLTVDEAEAEQDAVQTRVRKGPAQPTEEQIMHAAQRDALPLPRMERALRRGGSARLAALENHPFSHSGPDVTAGLLLPEPPRGHGHLNSAELHALSLGCLLRAVL